MLKYRRRFGSSPASSDTMAAWASVSAKTSTAPESCSTQRTWSAEEVS